jgi:hypothetical protein
MEQNGKKLELNTEMKFSNTDRLKKIFSEKFFPREFFPHVEKEKKKEIWSCKSRIGQFLYRKFLAACRALYRWNMPKDEELFKKQTINGKRNFSTVFSVILIM